MLTRITFTTVSLLSMLIASPAGASAPHKRVHKPVSAVLRASPVHRATRIVSASVLQAWGRVAVCEEGGWQNSVDGPTYFGSIGWLWSTWQMFRRPDFPVNMYYATAQQQSWAGQRFVAYYHISIPDQVGCSGGY